MSINVLVCIQARSTSKRLPGKSLEMIDDMVMVDHVLDAAKKAAFLFNRQRMTNGSGASACLLVPSGDPLVEAMAGNVIFQGSEDDVLSRFETAVSKLSPDYVVRLTADCPLITETIIYRHIHCAVEDGLDYVSNTVPGMSTFIDGHDVEVISTKLMRWLFRTVTTSHDKEHVTTLIKSSPPGWAKLGTIIGRIDLSHIKLSVDTKEELEFVRRNKESVNQKLKLAKDKKYKIFRF